MRNLHQSNILTTMLQSSPIIITKAVSLPKTVLLLNSTTMLKLKKDTTLLRIITILKKNQITILRQAENMKAMEVVLSKRKVLVVAAKTKCRPHPETIQGEDRNSVPHKRTTPTVLLQDLIT